MAEEPAVQIVPPAKVRTFFPTNIIVRTSTDGSLFADAVTLTGYRLSPKSQAIFIQLDGVDARYVRIVMNTARNIRDKHFYAEAADVNIFEGGGVIQQILPANEVAAEVATPLAFSATPSGTVTATAVYFSSGSTMIGKATKSQSLFKIMPKTLPLVPTAAIWRSIQKAADENATVYWRLEAASATYGEVFGPVRSFQFATGELSADSIIPSTIVEGIPVLTPGPLVAPTFTFTYVGTAMKYFFVAISPDASVPLGSKTTMILPQTALEIKAGASTHALTKTEWKKVRQMASAHDGLLYFRFVGKDANKILSTTSAAAPLEISGGTLTLTPPAHIAAGSTFSWSGGVDELVGYSLEFTYEGPNQFVQKPAYTIKVPAKPLTASPYMLINADASKLLAFLGAPKSTGTLLVWVKGVDADGAFAAYSAPVVVTP